MASLRAVSDRPLLAVQAGIAAAWIALLATTELARGSGGGGETAWDGLLWVCRLDGGGSTGHAVAGGAGSGGLDPAALLAAAPMWSLMAVAMMVPPALPAVHHVAVNSLYWRRRRAVVEFLLGFLGIWVAFSVVVLGGLSVWGASRPDWVLAAALALAAAWQLTPLKRRALRACHRPSPLPPKGWRATLGAARFGWRNGSACLVSCWAMMVAVALVTSSMLVWMAALTALICFEKLSLKPGAASRRVAIPLALAAGVALALALA